MAKITSSLFIALDGVVEVGDGAWHFPYYDDEMGAAVDSGQGSADTMLFGRVTYESFAGAWPEREEAGDVDADFARRLGDMRKIVVSSQPLRFSWRNSEQLRGALVDAVRELRRQPGHIALSGSPSVVRQLLAAGLIDELHLFVHPIAAGSGARLFDDDGPVLPLRLLSAKPFDTGVLHLVYGPDTAARQGSYDEAKQHLAKG
ncbi:dihydrofolate reductase family protein [Antribacter gilvus]|uniref:dihydrofolate reductase family protein n=1 Tax=Antribacter gilvus TaxID=2304675 RepID=UPI000F7871AF|nr:dihydrofolate reductase family protein [Antribacter gilvus]